MVKNKFDLKTLGPVLSADSECAHDLRRKRRGRRT